MLTAPLKTMAATAAAAGGPLVEAATTGGIIESALSLSSNVKVIGGLWMVSSALLTTWSTTTFLKYQPPDTVSSSNGNNKNKIKKLSSRNPLATATSSTKSNNLLTSKLLKLPRPALLTLFRFGGSLLLGLLLHTDVHIVKRVQETLAAIPDFAVPAAFLFVANYANSIALNRIGISLTYTSKCAIPIFTVLVTWLLDGAGALPNLPTLLSLLPIAAGIALASWDSPVFESKGFGFAMLSCSAQTALNVSSKKALIKTGLSGPDGQRAMVAVGLAITAVYFLLHAPSAADSGDDNSLSDVLKRPPPSWLAAMAFTAYHLEYMFSFMFVKLVQPITYGACDAVRRLSIIISGHYMFGHDRFTKLNIVGIAMALMGALSYAISSHAF